MLARDEREGDKWSHCSNHWPFLNLEAVVFHPELNTVFQQLPLQDSAGALLGKKVSAVVQAAALITLSAHSVVVCLGTKTAASVG